MTPINPEEVVSNEEALDILEHLVVLCPSYQRPEIKTAELLSTLMRLGTEIIIRTGISDIATARNLVASDAYHRLHDSDGLRFRCLFWLDGDMLASPHHIAAVCKLALEHQTEVTGLCCPRGTPNRIAAKRLPVVDPDVLGDAIELWPVYSGLACLGICRDEFIGLCNHVDWFELVGQKRAPALCQSRMSLNPAGDSSWLSEDMYYSKIAWEHGRGIYLAPIEFGHLSLVPVTPGVDARFLDDGRDEPTTVR